MEIDLLKLRLVSGAAIEELVDDVSYPTHIKLLSTWPRGFRKAVLRAYTEFIELKIVHRDYTSCCILPPYPLKQLWKRHSLSAKYNDICERLFKCKIEFNYRFVQEHVSYTMQAYELRFNRKPNPQIWDYTSSISAWERRIANWDRWRSRVKKNLLVPLSKTKDEEKKTNTKSTDDSSLECSINNDLVFDVESMDDTSSINNEPNDTNTHTSDTDIGANVTITTTRTPTTSSSRKRKHQEYSVVTRSAKRLRNKT